MKLIVYTGGVRSGKSQLAGKYVTSRLENEKVYVLSFGDGSVDAEFEERIARHKLDRPSTWHTLEPGLDLESLSDYAPEAGSFIILDCLGTLLGGILKDELKGYFEANSNDSILKADAQRIEDRASRYIDEIFARSKESTLVLVTNEVGLSLVPLSASGRLFTDILGRLNQKVVKASGEAYFVVSGRALRL